MSNSVRQNVLEIVKELQSEGLTVETDLLGRGFGSQLDYVDSINAEKVVIVGERDLKNNEVTVKEWSPVKKK